MFRQEVRNSEILVLTYALIIKYLLLIVSPKSQTLTNILYDIFNYSIVSGDEKVDTLFLKKILWVLLLMNLKYFAYLSFIFLFILSITVSTWIDYYMKAEKKGSLKNSNNFVLISLHKDRYILWTHWSKIS